MVFFTFTQSHTITSDTTERAVFVILLGLKNNYMAKAAHFLWPYLKTLIFSFSPYINPVHEEMFSSDKNKSRLYSSGLNLITTSVAGIVVMLCAQRRRVKIGKSLCDSMMGPFLLMDIIMTYIIR